MKQLIKFGFLFGLTVSNNVFSVEPVQGVYFGILGQISHATPNPQLNFTINDLSLSGSGPITLSPVGGGAALSLGYRIERVRLEGELLFNINNYGELTVGSCTLVSPNVIGPEGTCPSAIDNNTGIGLGFNGNTIGLYGMFNVFYDFISSDTNVKIFPYIGAGLGGAIIRNSAKFASNKYNTSGYNTFYTVNTSNTGFAAQGIVGVGSFMDDFATIGMDLRYTSAFKPNSSGSSGSSGGSAQFGIITLNFTGTFALDKGNK